MDTPRRALNANKGPVAASASDGQHPLKPAPLKSRASTSASSASSTSSISSAALDRDAQWQRHALERRNSKSETTTVHIYITLNELKIVRSGQTHVFQPSSASAMEPSYVASQVGISDSHTRLHITYRGPSQAIEPLLNATHDTHRFCGELRLFPCKTFDGYGVLDGYESEDGSVYGVRSPRNPRLGKAMPKVSTDELEVRPDGMQERTKSHSYQFTEGPRLTESFRLSQSVVIEEFASRQPFRTAYSETMTCYGGPVYPSDITGNKQVVWNRLDKVAAARMSSKARTVGLASKDMLTAWKISVGAISGQKPPEKDSIGAVPFASLSKSQRKFIKECGLLDNDKTKQAYSSVLYYAD